MTPNTYELIQRFWSAADSELFDEGVVAAVLGKSTAWCQRARWAGRGPRYYKLGRNVRYCKHDVLAWIGTPVKSTSEADQRADPTV